MGKISTDGEDAAKIYKMDFSPGQKNKKMWSVDRGSKKKAMTFEGEEIKWWNKGKATKNTGRWE